jgi:succinate dehydrogenase / fumarate reductase membrane anchor subunit
MGAYSSFERGGTAWLLQRLTAAFLILVLAFHFFLLHFVNHAYEIEFAGTQARMQQFGYLVTMVAFLVTATFHGLNGVYNALVNQGLHGRLRQVVAAGIVLAGIALVVQGTRLALFLSGVI